MVHLMDNLLIPLHLCVGRIVRFVEIELSEFGGFADSLVIGFLAWGGLHLDRGFDRDGNRESFSVWRLVTAQNLGRHFAFRAAVTG